ncbi:hypothetical protein Rvan_1856 [Rhodomicrobium vannielii ATCC 17100]|jgi:hypothetical protein|uniref:DUF2946 domain-containing protein n=1 Tax=Rhodomicrobium vannielii (strain ATCC 17100 / DSM 162 / LMG 4299 / NCIMB 10020 / ATH 3.1.1) TaxID=648757 RepID=E3I063_RHOVT|nr:hypothetical protein [Rhodomicrobium vannielii]ADP71098.1 hypothetical protein Rvan_1856 [Rhodomicrobium vannielii ATCC 17100]
MGKPFEQFRTVAIWLALAAALTRVVLVAGLMPVVADDGFALVVCRGVTPDPSREGAPVDRTHDPCPFALNGVGSPAIEPFNSPKPRWTAERIATPVPDSLPRRPVAISTFRPRAPPVMGLVS